LGTIPVSLLKDKLICCKLGKYKSGISPETELFARFKACNWVKFDNELGIVPLNPLLDKLTMVRFFQTEKSNGNGPVNLLN